MLQIENLALAGDELAIAWSDGHETYLKLEHLRRACPCASCQGEPDAMGQVVRPTVQYNDRSFELLSYEVVGGYALQPSWGDGHRTGLYAFDFLRKLGERADRT